MASCDHNTSSEAERKETGRAASQVLAKQYIRMYPLRDIAWKEVEAALCQLSYEDSQALQRGLLDNTVLHPVTQQYPPTTAYSRLFLKALITKIEECNVEVHEDLYSTYSQFLSQQQDSSHDEFCHRTYELEGVGRLTLRGTCKLISEGTTGMCTWEASQVMAEWCTRAPHLFEGLRVLELGAGLGLLGLVVVRACHPASYVLSDLHPAVLTTLTHNVRINLSEDSAADINEVEDEGLQLRYGDTQVEVRKLDWEADTYDPVVDVVLAADVVYDPEVVEHLVRMLKQVLSRRAGAAAYVASTLRNTHTYTHFMNTLASAGLVIQSESLHQYQESPSQPQQTVAVVHITTMNHQLHACTSP